MKKMVLIISALLVSGCVSDRSPRSLLWIDYQPPVDPAQSIDWGIAETRYKNY